MLNSFRTMHMHMHRDGYRIKMIVKDTKSQTSVRLDVVFRVDGKVQSRTPVARWVRPLAQKNAVVARATRLRTVLDAVASYLNTGGAFGAQSDALAGALEAMLALPRIAPTGLEYVTTRTLPVEHVYYRAETGTYVRVVEDRGTEELSPGQMHALVLEQREKERPNDDSFLQSL